MRAWERNVSKLIPEAFRVISHVEKSSPRNICKQESKIR